MYKGGARRIIVHGNYIGNAQDSKRLARKIWSYWADNYGISVDLWLNEEKAGAGLFGDIADRIQPHDLDAMFGKIFEEICQKLTRGR